MSYQDPSTQISEKDTKNLDILAENDQPDQMEQYIVLDEDNLDNCADNSVNEDAESSDIIKSMDNNSNEDAASPQNPTDKTKNKFILPKLQISTDILASFASELVNSWLVDDIGTSDKTIHPEDLPLICEWCHCQCSTMGNFEKHKRKNHHKEGQAVYNLLTKGPKSPDFMRPRKIRKLQMKEMLKREAASDKTSFDKVDSDTTQELSITGVLVDAC